MRLLAAVAAIVLLFLFPALGGCNGSPFLTQRPSLWPSPPSPNVQTAQLEELSRRINQLDANNRDLHTEIAQYRQDLQKERELRLALQKQLNETTSQLSQLRAKKSEVEQRLAGLQASTRQRGSAIITANNSLQSSLDAIDIPGAEARQDGDVIRIAIPADQLFIQGSDQLRPGADQLLDQVARTISRNYPRQIVGIEGHTDNTTAGPVGISLHQLAASQAMAVFNQIVRSGRVPSKQLFTLSHGPNHPRFSNGDAAGRAKNRRIEIVIYPETVDGQ